MASPRNKYEWRDRKDNGSLRRLFPSSLDGANHVSKMLDCLPILVDVQRRQSQRHNATLIVMPIFQLDRAEDAPFPPVDLACHDPPGLLATGGDLSCVRLLTAYRSGIFPWFDETTRYFWWSPDPRAVFDSGQIHLDSRFRRWMRLHCHWHLRADTLFATVVKTCAEIARPGQQGTWMTAEMQSAYRHLHTHGYAHSVEVLAGDTLVGGLFGLAIGRMFFAESMFSRQSGGSKVALAALGRFLTNRGAPLIDIQFLTPHLARLGAHTLSRTEFIQRLSQLTQQPPLPANWSTLFPDQAATTVLAS